MNIVGYNLAEWWNIILGWNGGTEGVKWGCRWGREERQWNTKRKCVVKTRPLKILYSVKARRNLAKKPESTISELYKLTKGL